MHMQIISWCILVATLLASQVRAVEQEVIKLGQGNSRHLVVMVGLPGDGDYRNRMVEAVKQIATAAPKTLQIASDRCHFFVSDNRMVDELKSDVPHALVCTSSTMHEFFAERSTKWNAHDSVWLIMIGHTQIIDARCAFNVHGTDFAEDELAAWLKPLPCREQVLLLTMPSSGSWLAKLKAPGRVNIAATDTVGETTGTEYPYALASILAGQQTHQALEDLDLDGKLTLLDLYLATALEVDGLYKGMERLATEHAQLDDNGDGRAKEIQEPLIPIEPEEGDEVKPAAPRTPLTITDNSDGALARSIKL